MMSSSGLDVECECWDALSDHVPQCAGGKDSDSRNRETFKSRIMLT